jgi:RNA polymerase sigma factor (sigma-70 family)
MPFEPDHRLLSRFVAAQERGDSAAAAELWKQLAVNNFDRVQQIVKAFQFSPGNRLPAEEHGSAASEAYLRVISMGASFRKREPGSYYAALYRCVQNACFDYGRKELRHQRRSGGSLDQRFEPDGESGPFDRVLAAYDLDRRRQTEDALDAERDRRDAAGLVAWALGQISNDNYREVLEMTYLQQLSAEAIAERLDITMPNLYQRRSRGQRELEKILRAARS